MEVSGSTSRPSSFTPGKEHQYPLNRGWVGPRHGLNVAGNRKIACLYRESNPGLCSATDPNEYDSPSADNRFCSHNVLRIIKGSSFDAGTREDQKFM